MKFITIKNIIKIFSLAGLTLGGSSMLAMENNDADTQPSIITNTLKRFAPGAASFAIARYAPQMIQPVMSHIAPEYPLVQSIVPHAVQYCGYGLATHLMIKKGLGINYSDLIKRENLKKVVKSTAKAVPCLLPSVLCHPQVAQSAANYCTNLATPYVSDSHLTSFNNYAEPTLKAALMAVGAFGTAYLMDKAVFNGKLLENVKRVCKDLRPYSFLAPVALTYKSDEVKNYVMEHMPSRIPENLRSDMGTCLKAGLFWGGMAAAAYLFTTETLDIPTRGYIKDKVNELLKKCSDLTIRVSAVEKNLAAVQNDTDEMKKTQATQIKELNEFSNSTQKAMQEITEILKELSNKHTLSEAAVRSLVKHNANLVTQANNLSSVVAEVIANLEILKKDHTQRLAKIRAIMQDNNEEFFKIIEQKNREVEVKIGELEKVCTQQAVQFSEIQPKLNALVKSLHEEGQTYNMDQKMIQSITQMLDKSCAALDTMIEDLERMHKPLRGPAPAK